MRIITEHKIIIVEDWFVIELQPIRKTAKILNQTEKAICLQFPDGKYQWIPLSLCKIQDRPKGLEGWI